MGSKKRFNLWQKKQTVKNKEEKHKKFAEGLKKLQEEFGLQIVVKLKITEDGIYPVPGLVDMPKPPVITPIQKEVKKEIKKEND